jgi:hypothetical protein
MGKYRLEGTTPVLEPDLMAWARWYETANDERRVAEAIFGPPGAEESIRVSTVFLGIDHQWGNGPPMLFETMVFADGSEMDLECERYATWDEAMAGHLAMVERVKAARDGGER